MFRAGDRDYIPSRSTNSFGELSNGYLPPACMMKIILNYAWYQQGIHKNWVHLHLNKNQQL